VEEKGVNLVF
jgi:hypothetical protein